MQSNVIDKIRFQFENLLRDKRTLIKIMSIAVILLLALILKNHNSTQDELNIETTNETIEHVSEELYVDIGGAVTNPGVYKVPSGTRLFEVIEIAGGLRSDADTNSVNQAAYVEDGEKVIIPNISEVLGETEGVSSKSSLININLADKETLKSLSGIGDAIADRIIEYRSNSKFKSKEEIMSVKGIGDSVYEKIKDDITV